MDLDEAYRVADEAVRSTTGRGLNNVQKVILQGSLQGETYEQIAESSHYTVGYLKKYAGPRLWKTLTAALQAEIGQEEIGKTNCQAVLTRLLLHSRANQKSTNRHLLPLNSSSSEARVPEVGTFFGRTYELNMFEQWIVKDRCRLIFIFGVGGVGKTSLAAKLAHQTQNHFERVFWFSLNHAPLIETILSSLQRNFANGADVPPEPNHQQISQFVDLICQHRILLFLDSTEALLSDGDRVGYFQKIHQPYAELIKQVSERSHSSCLVVISREEPVIQTPGEPQVRRHRLRGLLQEDAKQLLENHQVSSSQRGVEELIHLYRGNPLALKMVVNTIQDVFNGNIYQLLNQGTVLVNNPLLSLLHEQFNRLSELEKGIVYLLAIEQQLVSFNELRFLSKFFVSSASELITLLQSLKRRSLLEDLDTEGNEMTYTLPPVVMKHAITQLVEQVCQELLVVFETSPIQQLGLLRTHCFMKDVQPQEATQMPQLRFILSPIVDRLQRAWKGEVDLQEKLNEILSMLEGKASQQVGHARINIQNLLKLIEDEPR